MPVRYILSNVWVRLSIFSQLSIIQYVGLCVFSIPISFMMIERMYILCLIIIIIKSEVWTIIHFLGLGHETMVCAVCLSIFLWGKPIWWLHLFSFGACQIILQRNCCRDWANYHVHTLDTIYSQGFQLNYPQRGIFWSGYQVKNFRGKLKQHHVAWRKQQDWPVRRRLCIGCLLWSMYHTLE